jgi:feruloyl esterase
MPWADALEGNPGRQLLCSQYIPARAGASAESGSDTAPLPKALVVVLHGCRQHSQAFAYAAGWTQLADRFGWIVLAPQQLYAPRPPQPGAGHGALCWNWYLPDLNQPGVQEANIIVDMIRAVTRQHWPTTPPPVYVVGLSAGGAMSALLMARHPDIFVAGAIVAGLPYGCARNGSDALRCMQHALQLPPEQWAQCVHEACPDAKRWPRVSLWHGTRDSVVAPENLTQLIFQWTALHGLNPLPTLDECTKGGHSHRVYGDPATPPAVEACLVHDMPHGMPVDPGPAPDQGGDFRACGWIWPAGIFASYHIAQFWGLVS